MIETILEYWVLVITGVGLYFIRKYLKKLEDKLDRKFDAVLKEYSAVKYGTQAMLRDRIIQSYNYLTQRGYATIDDRDNLFNMYEHYHNLGENGVIDGLMDEICNLPVRNPKERE